MSKPDANFGGGKKNKVYHLIQELIQEGKCAWFVNRNGRFRIKWEIAVERYIEYRAKKNPLRIDRRKASNSFREALLHRYCGGADGAKEYEECRKVGEKNKIVEREFQLPSKVFHSLFGSSEGLAGDQSETSGISVSDPEFTQEDKSLQLLGDLDYEVDMEPKESRLEGGRPFRVSFHPCLGANVTSVHAVFVKSEDILGNVELFISPSCLFGHSIPGAPSSGWANVIFKDQNDNHLGSTEIFYFPDGVEAVAMVQTPDQFKNFCEEMSFHTTSSFNSSDGDPQRYGAFGNAQQVQFLCLLIHTAAREGAQKFIEMIFSTSAGRLVFDAYKDSQPLPEMVARDHGHDKTACYLEDMTKRFSVRISASNEYPKKINWSELAQAAEEAQRCNAENESCHLMSDLLKDAGYLGDLETSSSEPHSSGSEDEIAIASKKVMQDVCPSFGPSKKSKEHVDCDKISPQTIKLTTPERRLADADTFSCASFEVDSERSDSGDRRVRGPGSNDAHLCVLMWGTFLMGAVMTSLLAGFIVKGFQSFTDVVEPLYVGLFFGLITAVTLLFCVAVTLLLFDSQLSIMCERYLMVLTHFIFAVVGILVYFMMTVGLIFVGFQSFTGAVEPLTVSFFFGLTAAVKLLFDVAMTLLSFDSQVSIMCERYLMVFIHCIFAVVGILVCFMMTVGSILVSFQSFTGAVEPLTVSFFFGLTAAVALLFCVAMTLLLLEIVCDFSIEAELKKKTEKKKLEEARYSSELRTPVCCTEEN